MMKYPFTLTEGNLKNAMADPRYTNSRHPDSRSWRGMVSQGFATLYPDQTLRGDHTDQLEHHQGADGHIYASDGTKVANGSSGSIHVRSYSRTVNGKLVEVAAHNRSGGSGGGDTEPAPSLPPPPRAKDSIEDLQKKAAAQGGWLSSGADKTVNDGKECVALVKAAVPELGPTRAWKAGEPVIPGDPNLKPGTPVGAGWDKDGGYASKDSGNHVGIFDSWLKDDQGNIIGIKILDQNSGPSRSNPDRKELPAKVREKRGNTAWSYRVIRRK